MTSINAFELSRPPVSPRQMGIQQLRLHYIKNALKKSIFQ